MEPAICLENCSSASIEGKHFIYKDLVSGIIKESPKTFPDLDENLLEYAIDYLDDIVNPNDSIVHILAFDKKSYHNSFFNKTVFLYNDILNKLSNHAFSGNIVLFSTKELEVIPQIDIVLIAPRIITKKDLRGDTGLQFNLLKRIAV